VVSAGPSNISPLSGDFSITGIGLPGQRPNERMSTSIDWVGPDYFKTLGTPLVAGRVFTEQDGSANKVAIVNEKLAGYSGRTEARSANMLSSAPALVIAKSWGW